MKICILIILFSSFTLLEKVNPDDILIITKQKVAVRKEANLNSLIVEYIEKDKKYKMIKKEGDFAKIAEGKFIHKEGIKVFKQKIKQFDVSIEVIEKKYGQKIDKSIKEGLSLNGGDKEYIEIMKIDSVNFDSIKIR